MAAQVGSLRVTVGADISGLTRGMTDAQRQVARSAGAMKKSVTELQLTFQEVATFSSRLFRTGALVFGGAFGANQLLKLADAAKSLSAQLKLATAEYGSFEQANKDVRAIAAASRTDLLATAELYATLQRNSGQLGASQAQVARTTETVAKSFAITNAGAAQTSQAIRQLNQAFQSGVLRGDEFNSIMENAPRLAKLLADSLGTTTGGLRKMAEAGELTADKLLRAFTDKKFTEGLDREFSQLPVTFDQAMTQVYNAALLTFGEFDRGGQFSNSIASFVQDGSEGFATLGQSAFHFGQQVADTFDAIDQIRQELGSLKTDGIGAFFGLETATIGWRDSLADALGVLDGVANAFANLTNAPGNLVRLGLGRPLILDPSNMRGGFLAETNRRRVDATRQQIMGRSASDVLAEFGLGRTPPPFVPPPAKAKKTRTKKPPRDRSDDATFQMERELLQAQAGLLRAQQELAGTVGQRAELELKMVDLDRQQFDLEQDDKLRRAKRDLAEKKITENAFREIVETDAKLRATRDDTDQLKRQAIMQEARTHRMERADALEQRGFEQRLDDLRFQDELATTQEEHRRVQLEIIDILYKQKEAHLRALKAQLIVAGKTEEAADIQAQLDQLAVEKSRDQERARRGTMGPLEDWARSVPKTAAEINEALQSIEAQGLDSVSDAIAGVITGTEKLKDAFADVAKSIIADIIRMSVRMLIFRSLSSAFGGLLGGSGQSPIAGLGNIYPDLGITGFASGGSFRVGGLPGIDRNVVSINGVPQFMASQGEVINVANDNVNGGSSRLIVELRDQMLDARIADGANVQIVRAYPGIQAGVRRSISEERRRG